MAMPPRLLLRLEGLAVLGASGAIYWSLDGSWGFFALLFLAPDLAFLAYLGGKPAGTAAYNLAHTTILPLILAAVAVVGLSRLPGLIALIWLAHIGTDRALGYGLKYPTAFRDTHFGRL